MRKSSDGSIKDTPSMLRSWSDGGLADCLDSFLMFDRELKEMKVECDEEIRSILRGLFFIFPF